MALGSVEWALEVSGVFDMHEPVDEFSEEYGLRQRALLILAQEVLRMNPALAEARVMNKVGGHVFTLAVDVHDDERGKVAASNCLPYRSIEEATTAERPYEDRVIGFYKPQGRVFTPLYMGTGAEWVRVTGAMMKELPDHL